MQVDSALAASLDMSGDGEGRLSCISVDLGHRLSLKDDERRENVESEGDEDGGGEDGDDEDRLSAIAVDLGHRLSLKDDERRENVESEGEDDDDEDFEFSFACEEASSPVSADEIFDNGQIRPVFPWFGDGADRETLSAGELEAKLSKIPAEKVFVERSDLPSTSSIAEGPYCVWSNRSTTSQGDPSSTAPDSCRKSNSTGFSKLWRFRDLLHRSHSDGKDTFVFLSPEKKAENEDSRKIKEKSTSEKKKKKKKAVTVSGIKTASSKAKTASSKAKTASSYAAQYGKKEGERRRSYLPYRQDLVGFFTNANSMSRNLHPY